MIEEKVRRVHKKTQWKYAKKQRQVSKIHVEEKLGIEEPDPI